ncbi:GNAT family N-acetyltransferase [Vibrio sp. vnigr-6D03]|uniref:GNAT family N-acetyltransferase n=1 Tax=Vibrio sp. vnigr-6D03 TaxID=2058088 RepID=UPI001F2CC12A|nr:GNAT family N-acetyltransferase [Vibrio sp. vnigr-6D03]
MLTNVNFFTYEFWDTFQTIIQAQETYAFDPNMSFDEAYTLWVKLPEACFVFKENNQILGSYYIKKNAGGPSQHISNCGYMVTPFARGKGVATAMCIHSQEQAISLGFRAMQFNSVVASNDIAVKLWQKLGFEILGIIPDAYQHKKLGFVDSYIMHKTLI